MSGAAPCLTIRLNRFGRLFADYHSAEQACYRKRMLHPIMHLIAVRTTLLERYPWLASNLYNAFRRAKALAVEDQELLVTLAVTLPWIGAELEATREMLAMMCGHTA
jgi:4,5-dihydroxyphthalate decarboxylase